MRSFLSLLALVASASAFSGVATFNNYAAQSKYASIKTIPFTTSHH